MAQLNSASAITLHLQASSFIVFNGLNFSEWCEQVKFHLGVMELDLALLEDKPTAITNTSSEEEKLYHKQWERSNRLSLMFLRMTIANNIKTTIPQTKNTKEYLNFVEERFRSADKSLAGTLMAQLTTMKYNGSKSMHKHIIEMSDIVVRLKTLGMAVDDSLVKFILNSLPPEYGPFQINYNTIKDKWNVNELASKLVQEETRLTNQGIHSINIMGQGAGKGLKPKANKFKKKKNGSPNASQIAKGEQMADKYRFCKKVGHYQKDCLKRKAWFKKKGISYDPNHKPI
ncbi:uncharacterized protein LOC110647588 [Hevea brasiliensis]|uniref:uncharacterized protein LOC110647588 n=1 Tax=Hevea brasiliensis TaxID=3981 RepID=UPI000B779634|nr:uncharacterized protein LOC110647588 [Hevea brasiliensis]